MKFAVVGAGYVGLSLAVLISQKYEVKIVDVLEEKVKCINERKSFIRDSLIENFFKNKKLNLVATLDYKEAFMDADYIVLCVPTDYDDDLKKFNVDSLEDVIDKIYKNNKKAMIVVKSTIPVGFIDNIKEKYKQINIFFSPEFSREGRALYDNLYPNRIIIGGFDERAKRFGHILKSFSLNEETKLIYMSSKEAESVKLFSNTYLAMRVSFFNELDIFAESQNMSSKNIIEGVCSDIRIGDYYNNPSFGYGGYCLPKDTKQLLASYNDVPQKIIKAIVESNEIRKNYVVDSILSKNPNVVGVYRLDMKKDSDNYRNSAIIDIINKLKDKKVEVVIFDDRLMCESFNGCDVYKDFAAFESNVDIIVANRFDKEVLSISKPIYTRDIFNCN